jgi:hypothetical protein
MRWPETSSLSLSNSARRAFREQVPIVRPGQPVLCGRHRVKVHLLDALDCHPGIIHAETVEQQHQQLLIRLIGE